MSLESRISDAIQDWCGQAPADFTMTLEDLWTLNSSLPFDPDGIELLIQALEREFENAPAFEVTLSPPDFRAAGKVKSVQNLIDEAATFPEGESDVIAAAAVPARRAPKKKKAVKKAAAKKTARNLDLKKKVKKQAPKKAVKERSGAGRRRGK
ncbi:MAG TPA: hypothetical protein VL285_18565 [Bryobacteraceae bacterium]|jgi:hypothetical protein|nr:hypothetical protein [Bryobacteraceae bacterium]